MRFRKVIGACLAAAAGPVLIAAWYGRRCRASAAEISRELPGDELVPGAAVVMDRAATLPAPPERVWPWLVQLGKGRGGWYLPAGLEALLPARGRGLRHVDPALRELAAGDEVPDWGPGDPVFRAVLVDPPRALVYQSVRDRADRHRWPQAGPPYPASALVASWALVLSAAPSAPSAPTGDGDAGTRLHLRLRIDRLGRRAPVLVTALAGLMDAVTAGLMLDGLAERLR